MQKSGISLIPYGNAAAMTAFTLGGFQSYQLAVIIANSVWKLLFILLRLTVHLWLINLVCPKIYIKFNLICLNINFDLISFVRV